MELFGIPSRRKNSEIKYVPTFREGLSFEATYFEVIFPVCFGGLLRAIFSCRTSSKFLKCSRGSEVTVTAGIDHIKGTCMWSWNDGYGRFPSTPAAGTLVVGTMSSMAVDTGTWHSGSSFRTMMSR